MRALIGLLTEKKDVDFIDLANRLNRALGYRDRWSRLDPEDMESNARSGEPILDIRADKNDPRLSKLKSAAKEVDFSLWSDYGAVGQKEWFITGYLKR